MESTMMLPKDQSASSERTSHGTGSWWPVVLIAISLAMVTLYLPLTRILSPFNNDFTVYNILTTIVLLPAPLLYIAGVWSMQRERAAGKSERAGFETIGGITLVLGAIYGALNFLSSID